MLHCEAANRVLPRGAGAISNDVTMLVLAVGTAISFIPQWIEILLKKSAVGVSPTTILLMNVVAGFNTLGLLLNNWPIAQCCANVEESHWSSLDCHVMMLPVWLLGANLIGSVPIFVLVVAFFHPDPEADVAVVEEEEGSATGPASASKTTSAAASLEAKRIAGRRVAAGMLLGFVIVTAASIGIAFALLDKYGVGSKAVLGYAEALDISAAVLMSLMWAPQIWHTFRMKAVGSLSILMILVQAPGSAAVVVTLLISEQSVFSTLPTAAACVAQTILLIECLYYAWKNRKAGKAKSSPGDSEKEPLLVNDGLPEMRRYAQSVE